jgi:hypothetical protein
VITSGRKQKRSAGFASEEGVVGKASHSPSTLSAPETRAQDETFVQQCSFAGLRAQLPLHWPTPPGIPDSPKKKYRSHYVYLGCDDLDDQTNWEQLSLFDLLLRLVDFSGLRPVLAYLLGWTSARGEVPFDPVSTFLFVSWRLLNGWSRARALRNLAQSRYADYAAAFGFHEGDFPTEGAVRYFLTTLGQCSDQGTERVSVTVDATRTDTFAVQRLNQLIVASVTLLHQAGLITPSAWQAALISLDGQIHDAASRRRCTYVQAGCYRSLEDASRPCRAKEKNKRGCDCDTVACIQACRHAPIRDPEARAVVYEHSNQRRTSSPNSPTDLSHAKSSKGELRYGYRSLTTQFSEPVRRFSLVLLDDFLSANAREENPGAALLLQLPHFYPDLGIDTVVGDAGFGYSAFLHTTYQLGAKRVVDLRADPSDKDPVKWTVRGYNDKGRPVCPFGYAFTANGFDAQRQRHKWFCAQACLNRKSPLVQLKNVDYPPEECPYQEQDHPHGKIVNVGETFADGSIRLARDVPFGTPSWKRLYHRARNAAEDRNADLQAWGLKRLPVYGRPRGRALIALADVWINLTSLARLVQEATFAAGALHDD